MTFLSEYIDCYKDRERVVTYIIDTLDIVTMNAVILLNEEYDRIVIVPRSDCKNYQLLSQYRDDDVYAHDSTALDIWGYYEARQ